jgi:type I restriction enzyme S subunit
MDVKPGFKLTEVGVFPEDWTVLPLEEFTTFISYGFTNPMPTSESGIFMITAKDVNHGRIQFDTARCTTEEAYRTLLTAKSRPKNGDLLLTKDGTLGRLALVDDRTVCINQSVAIIRPNAKIVPDFLKILLEAPAYQRRMLEDAGGSTIKHIYITIVNRMPVAVPPTKAEQQAIAEELRDADSLIESLERLIAKKRDLKRATMQQLLSGKRRLPGSQGKSGYKLTELGVIPADWEAKELGSILDHVHLGGNYPNQDQENDRPLMKMGNLGRGDIDLSKIQYISSGAKSDDCDRLQFGDLLFNTRNTLDLVGKVSIWRNELPLAYYNSNIMRLSFKPEEISSNFYANYAFNSPNLLARLREIATGTTSVGAIYTRDLLKLPFPVPPLPEQESIAESLSDMDAELAALEQRLDKNRAVKQSMMQELLTGKIRLA